MLLFGKTVVPDLAAPAQVATTSTTGQQLPHQVTSSVDDFIKHVAQHSTISTLLLVNASLTYAIVLMIKPAPETKSELLPTVPLTALTSVLLALMAMDIISILTNATLTTVYATTITTAPLMLHGILLPKGKFVHQKEELSVYLLFAQLFTILTV
jgi:hypothetical protein